MRNSLILMATKRVFFSKLWNCWSFCLCRYYSEEGFLNHIHKSYRFSWTFEKETIRHCDAFNSHYDLTSFHSTAHLCQRWAVSSLLFQLLSATKCSSPPGVQYGTEKCSTCCAKHVEHLDLRQMQYTQYASQVPLELNCWQSLMFFPSPFTSVLIHCFSYACKWGNFNKVTHNCVPHTERTQPSPS